MPPNADTRTLILEAALPTFLRFGYRKTSMDDVARAAGLSRQGLYLHFDSKDALFQGAATHLFERSLEAARLILRDAQRPLEERLVAAFDAWHGHGVDMMQAGGHTDELMAVGRQLVADIDASFSQRFIKALALALREVHGGLARAQVSERETAELLTAASKGLKHSASSRSEYLQGMRVAARLVVASAGKR